MDLELLDELEDRVDLAVNAVSELKMENELLREEARDLEAKVRALTRDLEKAGEAKSAVGELESRCSELEGKLSRVRGRIEKMVEKMKALEG